MKKIIIIIMASLLISCASVQGPSDLCDEDLDALLHDNLNMIVNSIDTTLFDDENYWYLSDQGKLFSTMLEDIPAMERELDKLGSTASRLYKQMQFICTHILVQYSDSVVFDDPRTYLDGRSVVDTLIAQFGDSIKKDIQRSLDLVQLNTMYDAIYRRYELYYQAQNIIGRNGIEFSEKLPETWFADNFIRCYYEELRKIERENNFNGSFQQ